MFEIDENGAVEQPFDPVDGTLDRSRGVST